MSASGRKKGKKKYTPIALDTILPNAVVRPTTSWAEEVESELQLSEYAIKKISNLNLPTAPRAACDLVIDESKIPPNGPFMAYLSNLPYEITEDDIAQQFKELKVQSIQLPKDDRQDRMKGFGYIEFKDKSNLVAALQQGELTLKGRNVRVSLPADEEQKSDRGSRSGGMSFGRNRDGDRDRSDKPLGEWRAGAPVPHDPDKSNVSKHSGMGFARQQNRDRDGGSGPFREFRRDFQPAESGPFFTRGSGGFRDRDDRDGGRTSERGGNRPFKRFEAPRPAFGKKFERDDRELKREPDKDEPKQRPRVELLPRSIPTDDSARAPQALPASIFGAAKPVDTSKREMEMEAKLHMMNANPVRNSSPRLTPTANLSRASSVSSLSSFRRRDGDSSETANDSSKPSDVAENDHSEADEGGSTTDAAPKNVWLQRSVAKTSTSGSTDVADVVTENTSASVIEGHSKVVDDNVLSSAVYVPPQPGSTAIATEEDSVSVPNTGADNHSSTRYNAPRPDTSKYDQKNWTTYGQDSFSGSQQSTGESGNRYGGGRGGGSGRYSDNKFGNNFNRDNRRERRENHRDGGERRDRYFSKRGSDDNFRGGESNNFPNKWNTNNRDGGSANSFRNRNSDYGERRRYDRESGGSFSRFRGSKNDNKSNVYGSSNHHPRPHESGGPGEYRGDERRRYNERLSEDEDNAQQQQQLDPMDSRLNESSAEHDCKPLENGQAENGVGVLDSEDGVHESSENLATEGESESAFKTRKKNKKKKNNSAVEGDEFTPNKRDLRSIDTDMKLRNQKEERRNPDNNHTTNDKMPSKNNAKIKETRNEKSAKKTRESRDEMPKQKEEKAPNFQDKNRFQFLKSED